MKISNLLFGSIFFSVIALTISGCSSNNTTGGQANPKDEPQQLGNNTSTKTDLGTQVTYQTTLPPDGNVDVNALYQKGINNAKSYQASLPIKFAEFRNPALAGGDYEFGSKATNFERFKNSPCYNKLGFNPIQAKTDSIGLEMEYQACEKETKQNMKNKYGIIIGSLLFILSLGILGYRFFNNRKK